MLMNGENCTDHTDYTDADERRELYGSHRKTRMQMNGENCTDHTDADEQRFRKIRRISTEQNSPTDHTD